MRGKKIYTAVAVILLIVLYIAIFHFSAEEGEDSSALSRKVTEMILDIYYRIIGGAGDGGGIAEAEWDSTLETIIRKMAHFGEYLCMGFLSYSVVALWYHPRWKGRFLVVLQLLVSAGLDELHQYFVPGRCAAFRDVMIDTAGGIVGIIFIVIIRKIISRRKFKRKSKKSKWEAPKWKEPFRYSG